MRSERVVLAIALAIPVLVALLGWPMALKWAIGPTPQAASQPTGAPATQVAQQQASRPTPRPTEGVPATIVPKVAPTAAAPTPVAQPAAPTPVAPTPVSQPAAPTPLAPTPVAQPAAPTPVAPTRVAQPAAPAVAASGDPGTTVARFYALVAQHDYASAAQLWSPRMQSAFPTRENINQRFSQTQSVAVERADVISQDALNGNAAVAVDVLESRQDGARHWVGTWYLVRGPAGWLLDQPELRSE